MTIKSISTLGCHPLTLLTKLAAIDGITLLKTEKHTFNNVDYPYHIVAKLGDNLYIDAYDKLFAYCDTAAKLPVNPNGETLLEVLDTHKSAAVVGNGSSVYKEFTFGDSSLVTDTVFPTADWSVLFSAPATATSISASYYSGAFALRNQQILSDNIVLTKDLPTGEALTSINYNNKYGYFYVKGAAERYTDSPFAILNTPKNTGTGHGSENSVTNVLAETYIGYSYDGIHVPMPLMAASAHIKMATSVDSNNELVNPTDGGILPIFTDVICDSNFLAFHVPNAKGQFLVISLADTTKGNKLSGNFPVYYGNIPLAYNPNSASNTQLNVLGNASSPSIEVSMNSYTPTIPLANDNVTGGPVVSNIFALGADEVRGAVPGVLSCAEALSLGTLGWLDGVKYKVIKPGRMIKIG